MLELLRNAVFRSHFQPKPFDHSFLIMQWNQIIQNDWSKRETIVKYFFNKISTA